MKRILIIGDGVVPTGFSRVLHSIVEYLPKKDYDIYWLAVNYRGDPHPYTKYKIYPAMTGGDIYGLNRLQEFVEKKIDLIFILNDAWVIQDYLTVIKKVWTLEKRPKIITYIPVDAYDHDTKWYKDFDIVDRVVAYTEFGKDIIKEANPKIDPLVFPHGIDSKIFYKLNIPKEELRKQIYPTKPELWTEDSFIVLNANRNQPRKRIDISLRAFSMFAKNKPENVFFYYHGGVTDQSVNVAKLSVRYGIDSRLILTSMKTGAQSFPVEKLNKIYNATDIGINTSLGEGWGLVSMEHAATGAAQIVPAHSACREVFDNCGVMVRPFSPLLLDHVNTTGFLLRAEDVATAIQLLYDNKELRQQMADAAYTKFTAPEYSWKNISGMWDALFKEVLQ